MERSKGSRLADVSIYRQDKEKLEKKAEEFGETIEVIISWLVEEHLDEL